MVVFPIIAWVVSLACTAVVGRDAIRRPSPDRVVWTIAFAIFAVAAGVEVIASLTEWTPLLARVFYLSGAVLVVGYLALGELYLLARARIERSAPGITLLVTVLAVTLVASAPIDRGALETDAWEAIERGPALVLLTVLINVGGTIVLVGGALYSAWRFRKLGIQRHRMIGCLLIAAGTLAVASGGTLTRFGAREYLYIAMAFGIVLIFGGVLETRRPDRSPAQGRASERWRSGPLSSIAGRPALQLVSGQRRAQSHDEVSIDEALSYIESKLLAIPDAERDELCRRWSVERRSVDQFSRQQARLVWGLRVQLTNASKEVFDELPAAGQLQIAELYAEVLTSHLALSS